jgi:dTMP kinase
MSLFITFEGGEGSGKSSQSRALYRRLLRLSLPALLVHEPGNTPLGDNIARLLKWEQSCPISPLAELFLFNASRTELVREVIQPHLNIGGIVICDRYTDSTLAYQSYGRNLSRDIVQQVNDAASDGLKPDRTILLDIAVSTGLSRKKDSAPDRFETETISFHERVRQGFMEMSRCEPERWIVIDGSQTLSVIEDVIWQHICPLLPLDPERSAATQSSLDDIMKNRP